MKDWFNHLSKVAKGIIYTGSLATALVIIFTASSMAWDYSHSGYITVGALAQEFTKKDIKILKNAIASHEYDQEHGGLTDKQEWELKRMRLELEELSK
jgi:hypothetical protein